MAVNGKLGKIHRAWNDPSRILFPKGSRETLALLERMPDSKSADYYLLLTQTAREDLARTLACFPRSGPLGFAKLLLLVPIKALKLRLLNLLVNAYLNEIRLLEESRK